MTMTALDDSAARATGPYAAAAHLYWAAGWRGLLPLPPRAKKPVPAGYTGHAGVFPSYADVYAWTEGTEGAGNIALRMPHHVVGLDVDAYDNKTGGQTLANLEAKYGPLPATWRSTSRDDGVSGIRLYRVPEHLAWPGELPGGGIEIIQHRHRYTVAWPSVHPTGKTYRWIDPNGNDTLGVVPPIDDLPDLPDAWVAGITGGRLATDTPRVDLDDTAAAAWLTQRGQGQPCRAVRTALARHISDLTTGTGARHEAALRGTQRLAHLASEGHTGATIALEALRAVFIRAITTGAHRDTDPAEWRRMLTGAIAIAAAAQERPADVDPCENPFHDLIDRPRQEQTWNLTSSRPTSSGSSPSSPASPATAQTSEPPAATSGSTTVTAEPVAGSAEQADSRERTSWWPRDLDAVLTGTDPEPPPAYLVRDDGQALFYRAKVNGILGESESGKSWIALLAVTQAMAGGEKATYVDFEDTANGIVGRLTDMGVDQDVIRRQFRYIGPDESLDALAAGDLHEHLEAHEPAIVVVDGFNAAMSLLGLKINDNDDATVFAQRLLKPIAATGAAVVYVDHIPKAKDNETKGGIGAQAKRAMTTGCTLRAEVVKPFGRGESGKLRLTVDKDRAGYVRGASANAKQAGTAILTSLPDGSVTVVVEAPETVVAAAAGEPFRPTHLMEKVSRFLQLIPDGATGRAIRKEVSGNVKAVLTATERLAEEGYISCQSGPRNAVIYRHVRPYTELADFTSHPENTPVVPVVPSGSRAVPEPVTSDPKSSGSTGSLPEGEPEPLDRSRASQKPTGSTASGSSSTDPWFCRHCGGENDGTATLPNCFHCGRRP